MIIFLRLLSDLLWNFKAVNIITNVMLLFVLIKQLSASKQEISKQAKKPLMSLTIISILLIFSLSISINSATLIIFFKMILSFLVFLYGVTFKDNIYKIIRKVEIIGVFSLCLFFMLSFFGFAYQSWGGIRTFIGLYFYKTDMALAVVIFLSFILLSNSLDKKIKIFCAILSCYLIYITNARIHLLSVFLVIAFSLYGQNIFVNFKKKILILTPIVILGFVGLVFILNNFSNSQSLKIDLFSKDAYGDGNLQGRNQIWEAIFRGYEEAGLTKQIIGMGLDTDTKLTEGNLEDGSSHNAHNSYVYLLIATGALGLFYFTRFLYLIFVRFFLLTKYYSLPSNSSLRQRIYPILNLCFVNIIIFLVASLTASSIMFQQQTWFLMFFSGLIFNTSFCKKIFTHFKLSQ